MSGYSDFLQKYIKEKNIKVAKLIQYCELDRSSMYKIINGKRKPSSRTLAEKIANFLQLSPKECEIYYEAYYKVVMGEEVYEQNQQIMEFICNFNLMNQKSSPISYMERRIEIMDYDSIHILRGKTEIDYYAKLLLEKTTFREKSTVDLIVQCKNEYLMDTLLAIGKNALNLKIRHILCFQKKSKYAKENLEIIKKLLNFYGCKCQYEPFYYYDEVNSHFYNMNLFCNSIICEDGILCYTSDYAYGQFIRDEECIEVYRQIFEQYLRQTYPLLTKVDSIIQEYLSLGQSVLNGTAQAVAYSLHREPCVIPFIEKHILEKSLKKTMPNREQMIEVFHQYIVEERKAINKGNFKCSFTFKGVEDFILNGQMEEIPNDFYDPLEPKDCIEIVKKMLPYFKSGKYQLLKGTLEEIESDLHIFVAPSTGHFLFSKSSKDLVYIYMNEPGMIRQFYRFMEKGLDLYSPEKSVQKIQRLIEKYQEE